MVSLVVVALILVTGLSTWLAEDLAGDGAGRTTLIMTIVAVKLSMVGLFFMELRDAPRPLVLLFHGWIVAVWALIIGFHLVG
ncbi:cytochrome C oxidase subunit IV family protein [Frankia canadensis]|uniref:cytochrome C oxidase subunit IV family protein n=1 Tax=Frankia canadensis TaxID=1836972 RepID=UPI0014023BDC|nr:cytochrome C oxidase subunit IV family protein [Frankia canadensis]